MASTSQAVVASESEAKRSKTALDILAEGSTWLTLSSAFLFASGYIFLDSYYSFFGIDISVLDYPAYVYVVNGLLPVAIAPSSLKSLLSNC